MGIEQGKPVLLASVVAIVVLGVALVGGGIWLVTAGSSVGHTTISILGSTFESQSVGVVGIFAGLVLAVFGLRRVLKALEVLGQTPH